MLSGTVAGEVVSEESSFLRYWYARNAITTKTAASRRFLIRLLRLRGPKKLVIVLKMLKRFFILDKTSNGVL